MTEAAYILERTAHYVNQGIWLASARLLAQDDWLTYKALYHTPRQTPATAVNQFEFQKDWDEDQDGRFR